MTIVAGRCTHFLTESRIFSLDHVDDLLVVLLLLLLSSLLAADDVLSLDELFSLLRIAELLFVVLGRLGRVLLPLLLLLLLLELVRCVFGNFL